jgi:hypothetical protein
MTDFSKFSKEDSKEILDSCFKSANKLPQIDTLEDWVHAFLTLLEAECWSKSLDNKEKMDAIEKKSKATEDGCTCRSQALEIAARARILREGRFYNYIKDVLECHDIDKLAILSVKHKSLLLTKDEYKDLGLNERKELTKKETDAIYMWKCAKDGQYEKEKIAKCRTALEELGFTF